MDNAKLQLAKLQKEKKEKKINCYTTGRYYIKMDEATK